jgi:hypothetical protein
VEVVQGDVMARRNPAPTEEMRARVWYHGTPSALLAEHIAVYGIKPNSLAGPGRVKRGLMVPMKGRVYLTPNIGYAQIYALGCACAGHDVPQQFFRGHGDTGYVMVVNGRDLEDLLPDEDDVGELAGQAIALTEGRTRVAFTDLSKRLFTEDPEFAKQFARFAKNGLTSRQLEKILDGEYAYFAAGGKRLLRKLPDEWAIRLIKAGTNVAHRGGNLRPTQAWAINKHRSRELKEDGSNFFEIATLRWSAEGGIR